MEKLDGQSYPRAQAWLGGAAIRGEVGCSLGSVLKAALAHFVKRIGVEING